MLVDRTRENCQSWQVIKFAPRPVVFIRIVGTHNTANEVLVCRIKSSLFNELTLNFIIGLSLCPL